MTRASRIAQASEAARQEVSADLDPALLGVHLVEADVASMPPEDPADTRGLEGAVQPEPPSSNGATTAYTAADRLRWLVQQGRELPGRVEALEEAKLDLEAKLAVAERSISALREELGRLRDEFHAHDETEGRQLTAWGRGTNRAMDVLDGWNQALEGDALGWADSMRTGTLPPVPEQPPPGGEEEISDGAAGGHDD